MRALALLCAIAGVARAEPELQLTHEPPPRHLRMRPPRAAAVPAATVAKPAPAPTPPPQLSDITPEQSDEIAGLRDVLEPVSFSVTLGYQLDGARPSGKASLDAPVTEGKDYSSLRSYGFGEAFLSTRGVALDSLSSYFALRFDLAAPLTYRSPEQPNGVRVAPPIASWFEKNTFEVRTGWGELRDFLPKWMGLSKLRLRAGNQYIYGPWVMHLDGGLVAYDGTTFQATAYTGGRHSDYTTDITNERFVVSGASARLDLRELASVPIAIGAEVMQLTSLEMHQPDSTHNQIEVDWRPRRDFTVLASSRQLDGKTASQRLQFRGRYRQVTNLVFDIVHRFSDDWRWDPSLVANDDPTSARRYLDLGPVVPQLIASLRGGTVIAENIDIQARASISSDLTKPGDTKSSYAAPYVELGGALEVRLRRTIALGASVLSRVTNREELSGGPITDMRLTTEELPFNPATGEKSFVEVGTRVQMNLGARRFSAVLELYGRRTRYAELYRDPTNPIDTSDVRGGGRFSVDAWIGKKLRLFAAYDVSSAIEYAPEITGYKSLRLAMTGVY